MCLSNSKYQVIKMPESSGFYPSRHLGRSMRGIYYAISHSYHGLQLWYLDEPGSQIKWVLQLQHDIYLGSFGRKFPLDYGQQMDKHVSREREREECVPKKWFASIFPFSIDGIFIGYPTKYLARSF